MTVDDLILVEKQLKEQKPQVLFGVGGGTIIDCSQTKFSQPKPPIRQRPNNRQPRRHRQPPCLN